MPTVARKLGVVLPRLYRIINSGDLAAYKIGRSIRIGRVELEEYRKVKPGELSHLYPPGEDGHPPRKR